MPDTSIPIASADSRPGPRAPGARPAALDLRLAGRRHTWRRRLAALSVLTLTAAILGLGVGAVPIGPAEVAGILAKRLAPGPAGSWAPAELWPASHETILWSIRLPRVLLAALVGASLAMAGTAFQGLLRNPLADPYVLGVASGAALGAVITMALGVRSSVLGLTAVPPAAFAGALAAAALVYRLGRVKNQLPVLTLLLAGVAVASALSAVVVLIVAFAGERSRPMLFWLMGGLSGASWPAVRAVLPYTLLGAAVLALESRRLNALLLGEEPALYLGVPVERLKTVLVVAGSLLTAAAVSVAGVIGFVGLVVPHAVRIVAGPDHRFLVPASALAGAAFLILADLVARTALAPTELPVGAITALVGAPFFLWVLRRTRGGRP